MDDLPMAVSPLPASPTNKYSRSPWEPSPFTQYTNGLASPSPTESNMSFVLSSPFSPSNYSPLNDSNPTGMDNAKHEKRLDDIASNDIFFSGLSLQNNQFGAWPHSEDAGLDDSNIIMNGQLNNPGNKSKHYTRRQRNSNEKSVLTTSPGGSVTVVSAPYQDESNESKPYASNKRQQLHHPYLPMANDVLLDIAREQSDNSNNLPSPSTVTCNCKKSKCLKLYCQCFAVLQYCNNCKCKDCSNHAGAEKVRSEAIRITKERNTTAFSVKITPQKGNAIGCTCKKSHCLKKYCECFEANAHCGESCKCVSCENTVSSVKRENNIEDYYSRPVDMTPMVKGKRGNYSRRVSFSSQAMDESVASDESEGIPCQSDEEMEDKMNTTSGSEGLDISFDGVALLPSPRINQLKRPKQKAVPSNAEIVSVFPPNSNMMLAAYNQTSNSRAMTVASKKHAKSLTVAGNASSYHCPEMTEHSFLDVSMSTSSASFGDDNSIFLPSLPQTTAYKQNNVLVKKHGNIGKATPQYPFFGTNLPLFSKVSVFYMMEYLDDKDIYVLSMVNRLWHCCAYDDALWE